MIHAGRVFSLLILVLSVAAHAATFLPSVPITMVQVWPLHPAVLVAFFAAMIAKSRMDRKVAPVAPSRFFANPVAGWKEARAQNAVHWQSISRIPRVMRVVFLVAFAYAGLNFSLFIAHTTNGLPEKVGSAYFVKNKGRIIRPSNEAEYLQGQKWLVRGFSGHWILFSLVPVLFFTYLTPKKA